MQVAVELGSDRMTVPEGIHGHSRQDLHRWSLGNISAEQLQELINILGGGGLGRVELKVTVTPTFTTPQNATRVERIIETVLGKG